MGETERRCPSCGALVAPDAGWCGQCLQPLDRAEEVRDPEPAGRPGETLAARLLAARAEPRATGMPTWTCPVCEHVNAIELDRCDLCNTPFARLFAKQEEPVEVDPSRVFAWSLLLPGLGHWMAGRKPDAIARMVLFAWVFGTLLVLIVSRGPSLGSLLPIFLVYLAATVSLDVTSAIDARRVAMGEDPLVSSRTLLWAAVALIGVSVALATFLALPAARGQ